MPIDELLCPSHRTQVDWEDGDTARVGLDPAETDGGNRDYILRYRLQGKQVQTGLLLYPGQPGQDENFFLLMVQPPRRVEPRQIPPREYIFVLDVSGSMHGFPLDTAKTLMRELIGGLRPTRQLQRASCSRAARGCSRRGRCPPRRRTSRMRSRRSSASRGAAERSWARRWTSAMALPETKGVSRSTIVVTDGFIDAEAAVFEQIRTRLNRSNLFAFGIGSSVNRHLIEGMAHAGQGEPFVVTEPAEAQAVAKSFQDYVRSPVLTHVAVEPTDFQTYDVEPLSVPDLFAERPLIVFGKWRGKPSGTIRVTGLGGEGRYEKVFDVAEAKPSAGNQALRYLWARARVARLADYGADDSDDTRNAVTALGLKYELLTAYTSFVAVHEQGAQPGRPGAGGRAAAAHAARGLGLRRPRAGVAAAARPRDPAPRPDGRRADLAAAMRIGWRRPALAFLGDRAARRVRLEAGLQPGLGRGPRVDPRADGPRRGVAARRDADLQPRRRLGGAGRLVFHRSGLRGGELPDPRAGRLRARLLAPAALSRARGSPGGSPRWPGPISSRSPSTRCASWPRWSFTASAPSRGSTPEQVHRLLGTVLYLGALWGLFAVLDRLTSRRHEDTRSTLAAGVLVAGAYLGMTVVVPLLNGAPGRAVRRACHDGVADRAAVPGSTVRARSAGEELMEKPTILVVEDEPAIADTIQYALESEGFQCHRLEVGAGVVEVLDRQPVALVVLDIGLPDMSGIEVCRRIRQRHDVPVIFLTARADEVDRVVGLELGADDYVTKPFSPRELAARAKAVLRRARRAARHPPMLRLRAPPSRSTRSGFRSPISASPSSCRATSTGCSPSCSSGPAASTAAISSWSSSGTRPRPAWTARSTPTSRTCAPSSATSGPTSIRSRPIAARATR